MVDSKLMKGTDRLVFKLKDNTKVIINREYINENEFYFINITQNIDYILSDFAKECGYLLQLHNIFLEEDYMNINFSIIENACLKEEYHVFNGNELHRINAIHKSFPEEEIRTIPGVFNVIDIKEITGDEKMIEDMINSDILSTTSKDLAKYNIFLEPKLSLVKKYN